MTNPNHQQMCQCPDCKEATKRFISIEDEDGTIEAFEEHSNWKVQLDKENVSSWVWQFAENEQQAVSHHTEKHDQWINDMNSGKEEKNTY